MLMIQFLIILILKPLADFVVVMVGSKKLFDAKQNFLEKYAEGKILQMAFAGYIPATISVFLS